MEKQLGIGITIVVALSLCSAWAMGWFGESKYSDDPVVAEAEKMRDEIMKKGEEERREARGQIREAMDGMNEQQRTSFIERSMPIFVSMGAMQMEKRFDEFLAMPPEQQRIEMDKKIDEQIAREKEREANRNTEGGGDRPRRGPPKMSPEKMDEFRKKMQDWTTPEQCVKFQTVIGMYNERRIERGLKPIDIGRWR